MTTTTGKPRVHLNGRALPAWTQRFPLQLVLFSAGSALMPLGLLLILLGWYGAAHTRYQYNQMPYLISGGVLGLALAISGGFLYFGAWLSKIAIDERENTHRTAETMLVLADLVTQTDAADAPDSADAGATPVVTSTGTTVHRQDCPLIAGRDDVRALADDETGLSRCAACQPTLTG